MFRWPVPTITALPHPGMLVAFHRESDMTGDFHEAHRPQFHFTAQKGWLNDPNGLVYHRGQFHLYHQFNPNDVKWGPMYWGHALSDDLVHWRHLPIALSPDAMGTMYSGSAVVDWRNDSGLQQGHEPPLLAFYTAAGSQVAKDLPYVQCLAASHDGGVTWTKWAGNPVVPAIGHFDRDPKVFWHEPSRRWVMVLYVGEGDAARPHHVLHILSSTDLKTWQIQSRIDGYYECPELFDLEVPGSGGGRTWVLMAADGRYAMGEFDGRTFTPSGGGKYISDWGHSFYAAQTFNDVPAGDGRRILIGWMRGGQYPDMPFNQQMTIARELSLRRGPRGLRLAMTPVRELEALVVDRRSWRDLTVEPGSNPLVDVRAQLLDLELTIEPGQAQEFTLTLPGYVMHYVVGEQTLLCGERAMPLAMEDGAVHLRVLVDRTSVEVFGQHGLATLSACYLPKGEGPLTLLAKGGPLRVRHMEARRLRSIWPG
jgi:sucrose-6-phosphate hydrolase SacC (GH32 family)